MNTDDYAPEIKRLIKEFVNDYLRSPEFRQQLESIMCEEEKYLTREELCRYARLSLSTLWRIEKRQAIPHIMVGGRTQAQHVQSHHAERPRRVEEAVQFHRQLFRRRKKRGGLKHPLCQADQGEEQ